MEISRRMQENVHKFIQKANEPLNIIEEFAALSAKRKILLCDSLFAEGKNAFENAVRLLWPEASVQDMKKLESFLALLRQTA
jgi:hypothetical protein